MLQEGLKIFGLGFGTVFVGLICLILIIELMSRIFSLAAKKKTEAQPTPAEAQPAGAEIADRGAFIAAVSAAIATVMGKDVKGIRILSVKKIDK